ncbi:Hypothetical predicted protein [Pelobates cultripes]|uniref:Uncharacterized protein n=1 Tax=Pelobates cultripes TaxID=61616 RepID=A0AAD1SB75_PELCU|nr:Hypothetical predicted protein [Pelobates cultripes]
MAQQKGKKNATEAEKLNFFGNKSQNEQMEIRAFSQDGGASSDSTECPTPTEIDPDPDKLTKSHVQQALDALSQKLITTWQHSMDSLRKDVQELAPRDVLMRIHYYHIKERMLRVSRNKVKPPADFPEIKIVTDLSASTLRRRKDFSQIANTLRSNGIRFCWGFPTKMLLTKDGSTQVITSPEDGIRKLRLWGLTEKELEPQASPPRHLQLEWSRATPTKKPH